MRIHLTFGFLLFREGGGSHGWLKYFLLKILEKYFLPKILKIYFLPKYLGDPILVDLMSDPLHGGLASKSYLMKDFHGEEGQIRGIKLMILGGSFWISSLWSWEHFVRVGWRGLGEVVAIASTDCKCLFNVLINICLAYFLLVYVSLHMLVYCRWIFLI